MKKTTVLIAFLLFNMLAYGQNIGVRIGRNVSNYAFNKDSLSTLGITNGNLKGLALSVPIGFNVSKYLTIQTELGFLQKGFKSVQNIQTNGATVKSELKNYTNYAILPVLIRFHTTGRLQLYANIGPDFTYALNSNSKGTITNGNISTDVDKSNSLDGTDRVTFGLQAGGGLKFKLGPIALVLDTRFLTDLKDSQGTYNYQGLKDQTYQTKNWVTSFGIVFGKN